jgi:hypothetical protein
MDRKSAKASVDIVNLDGKKPPRVVVTIRYDDKDDGILGGAYPSNTLVENIIPRCGVTYDANASDTSDMNCRKFAFAPNLNSASDTIDQVARVLREDLGLEAQPLAFAQRLGKTELRRIMSSDSVIDTLLSGINGQNRTGAAR